MSVNREGGENRDRWAEVLKGWREGDRGGGGGEEVDERRANAVYKTQSASTSLTQLLASLFLQRQHSSDTQVNG